MSENQKVVKYEYVNLGWYGRDAAFKMTKHHYLGAYSFVWALKKPGELILPHDIPELLYTGKSGGGIDLIRHDFKNGSKEGTVKTDLHDRFQSHLKEFERMWREDCSEEKYRWFWDYRQANRGQLWTHFYVPNPQ